MSFLLTAIVMFSFWILLSGHFDPLLITLGIISSLLVAHWSHDLFLNEKEIGPGFRKAVRCIKYLPWLVWQITLANLHLIYLTLHPKMPIEPRVIRFTTELKTGFGIVALANSITLTPGTVTIKGSREEFIVHAITQAAARSLLSGEMQGRVKEVEGRDV